MAIPGVVDIDPSFMTREYERRTALLAFLGLAHLPEEQANQATDLLFAWADAYAELYAHILERGNDEARKGIPWQVPISTS